eukprot:364990-Chlamydomonas_euryale.AAC.2
MHPCVHAWVHATHLAASGNVKHHHLASELAACSLGEPAAASLRDLAATSLGDHAAVSLGDPAAVRLGDLAAASGQQMSKPAQAW